MSTVTVVMTMFNAEQFVADAIRSVLAQTYPDFELLIIDDGSTDESNLSASAFKDPRISLIWQPHSGSAGATNTGIKLARGQFVAMLDARDRWSPDKLERHVRQLRNNPQLGLSYDQSHLLGENGEALRQHLLPKSRGLAPHDILCGFGPEARSSVVWRMEALKDLSFDSGIGRVCFLNEILVASATWECCLRLRSLTNWHLEGLLLPLTWVRADTNQADFDETDWRRALRTVEAFFPELIHQHGDFARERRLGVNSAAALTANTRRTASQLFDLRPVAAQAACCP